MISIIVPIYNVEPYLRRCLESIAIQKNNLKEPYEVILVNDGSTDNSFKIAQEYAEEYSWQLISQANQGQSVARNVGFEHSTGDYIWFVDSDDWIAEDALRILCSEIKDQDIIAIGAKMTSSTNQEEKISSPLKGNMTGHKMLLEGCAMNAPFYIYRKEFLNNYNLKYYPNIFHEDFEFIPRTLYFAQDVSSITAPLYCVYKRPNSTTTTINPKRAFDYLTVIESISRFSQKIEEKDIQKKFDDLISLGLNNSLKCSAPLSGSSLGSYFETLLATNCINHLCKSTIFKYKIEGYFIKHIPKSLHIFRLIQI